MCHGFHTRDRHEFEAETDEDEEVDEPSFVNEEASVESEILTDGGDADEE
jgi:hypothetical protein